MSKLRMTKRRKVMTFTPVYDLHAKTLLGYLADLTLKGALMVSETPIEVDRTLTLAVEFRTSPEKAPMHMTVSARVAWCRLEQHRTYYNTGLEFLGVTDQTRNLIELVLQTHQFSREMPAGQNS